MKKIIIALSLFVLTGSAFAQISGGLFAGPNISWFSVDSKMQNNEGVKLGYCFGAMADFNISDNFVFTAAVKYNNVGGTMNYVNGAAVNLYDSNIIDTIMNKNIEYNMSYLAIPIGFKGKTNEIGFLSYYMKAGVAPMFRLKTIADIDGNSDDLFTDNINFLNMSWYMGGGFEWALSGNTRFIAEIVYNGGIMDFVRNKKGETLEDVTVEVFEDGTQTPTSRDHVGKISSLSLKVGILF
jgi:opacity protein-like surface antigen